MLPHNLAAAPSLLVPAVETKALIGREWYHGASVKIQSATTLCEPYIAKLKFSLHFHFNTRFPRFLYCRVFVPTGLSPYHPIAAIPKNALRQLKTSATIPLDVKPAGNGPGALFSPVRSSRSCVLPAALPATGILPALHTSQWSWGILPVSCD